MRRILPSEPVGEEPHLDPEMVAIIRRAVADMGPTINYSNGNGYKISFVLLGVLVSICISLSAWTLMSVVNLKVELATIAQCVNDKSTCDHRVFRGAVADD